MKLVKLGINSREEIEKRIQIVATAGKLSRTEGTVTQVYESRLDYISNLNLIKAIMKSKHTSIIEHDYFVFALEDVTPIVEQILISYRLTSFTVKSRRNVDFRDAGFYVPTFKDQNGNVLQNNESLQKEYKEYMQTLFDEYGRLTDKGLPIEECRYILPYSFNSNIIMGCDCNELVRVTSDLLYGKLSHIDELKELGEKFREMLLEYAPYIESYLTEEAHKEYYEEHLDFLDAYVKNDMIQNTELIPGVNMINYTENADMEVLYSIFMNRYQVSHDEAVVLLEQIRVQVPDIMEQMMNGLINNKNNRELEQAVFRFEFSISLAVLTHITRHRMHSLLVPEFVPMWNLENYMIPDSLMGDYEEKYREIFAVNKAMVDRFKSYGVRDEDLVHFYLSGNACNVSTTMDARTLMWISRMRTCNKAQTEIRGIVKQMVQHASSVAPLIGTGLGPYCKVFGKCHEGKDSCKERGPVRKLVKPQETQQ